MGLAGDAPVKSLKKVDLAGAAFLSAPYYVDGGRITAALLSCRRPDRNKKNELLSELVSSNRQLPTFPGSFPPSIIGARELNFCVRDGYRCFLSAIVTGSLTCLSQRLLC